MDSGDFSLNVIQDLFHGQPRNSHSHHQASLSFAKGATGHPPMQTIKLSSSHDNATIFVLAKQIWQEFLNGLHFCYGVGKAQLFIRNIFYTT
jgi:hypothetical protein